MHIKLFVFKNNFSVKAPKPGPISKTLSSSEISDESKMKFNIFSSTRKFCPNFLSGL